MYSSFVGIKTKKQILILIFILQKNLLHMYICEFSTVEKLTKQFNFKQRTRFYETTAIFYSEIIRYGNSRHYNLILIINCSMPIDHINVSPNVG